MKETLSVCCGVNQDTKQGIFEEVQHNWSLGTNQKTKTYADKKTVARRKEKSSDAEQTCYLVCVGT
jgi:hypothetical protein